MEFNTTESFLEKLNLWFNGLIALPLLAVGYGYLEIFTGRLSGVFTVNLYAIVGVIVILLVYAVIVTRAYKKSIGRIAREEELKHKLTNYFVISKMFYFKIFVVAMITVLGLYLTGSVFFAAFYAFLLFLLSIYRPSLLTVATKLGMKGEERKTFVKNSKTIIN